MDQKAVRKGALNFLTGFAHRADLLALITVCPHSCWSLSMLSAGGAIKRSDCRRRRC